MNTVGLRLREERKRLEFGQSDFAFVGGCGRTTQIKYEAGERFPNTDYLEKIAAAGADVGYIVTGKRHQDRTDIAAELSHLIDLIYHVADRKGLLLPREQIKTVLGFAFINGADEAAIAAFIDWQFPYGRSE